MAEFDRICLQLENHGFTQVDHGDNLATYDAPGAACITVTAEGWQLDLDPQYQHNDPRLATKGTTLESLAHAINVPHFLTFYETTLDQMIADGFAKVVDGRAELEERAVFRLWEHNRYFDPAAEIEV